MCYVQPTYPTDLKFSAWQRIEPWLPKPEARGGRTGRPRRWSLCLILNAIFYITRSGNAWRMLPQGFPPWKTVYSYFWKWTRTGLNQRCAGRAGAQEAGSAPTAQCRRHQHGRGGRVSGTLPQAQSRQEGWVTILALVGITAAGRRELIVFTIGERENQAAWENLLDDLRARGVQHVDLWITEGHPALLNAIALKFPASQRQRCFKHQLANVLAHACPRMGGAGQTARRGGGRVLLPAQPRSRRSAGGRLP